MAIMFDIGFQIDDKGIRKQLASIHQEINNAFTAKDNVTPQLAKATQGAMVLEKALKRATSETGVVSFTKINGELSKAGMNAAQLTASLAAGGSRFSASLNAANLALATANRQSITLSTKIKEIAHVFTQSFSYSAAQAVLRAIVSETRQAIDWVKKLDNEITNIGVVTGKTDTQLKAITEQTIVAAKNLKVAAAEYASASLIFYQQGLGDEEVQRRTEITIKAAKAANVAVSDMSQQLTAVWNTYNMNAEEQGRSASVLSKLAAETASEFGDMAEAMQSTASAASLMGVSYDSLAAIIATVRDNTQQSASTIGNAYKTIFSRFEQLKSAGTDGEVTLGQVSAQLRDLGVNVLDSSGELRQLDDVINELGATWDTYTNKQQIAIAETVGGTRQYSQFLSLMQNFDEYQKNLKSAQSEMGTETLDQQYEKAVTSIEAKAEQASEAWKRAFSHLIDEDNLKVIYDTVKGLGDIFAGITKTIGGVPQILALVGMTLSSKIVPAAIQFGTEMKTGLQNLTPGGRNKAIEQDYANQRAAIEGKISARTAQVTANAELGNYDAEEAIRNDRELRSLELQKGKLDVLKEEAKISAYINSELKTATGEYKIQLEQEKERQKSRIEQMQSDAQRSEELAYAASVRLARRAAQTTTTEEEPVPADVTIDSVTAEERAASPIVDRAMRQYESAADAAVEALQRKTETEQNTTRIEEQYGDTLEQYQEALEMKLSREKQSAEASQEIAKAQKRIDELNDQKKTEKIDVAGLIESGKVGQYIGNLNGGKGKQVTREQIEDVINKFESSDDDTLTAVQKENIEKDLENLRQILEEFTNEVSKAEQELENAKQKKADAEAGIELGQEAIDTIENNNPNIAGDYAATMDTNTEVEAEWQEALRKSEAAANAAANAIRTKDEVMRSNSATMDTMIKDLVSLRKGETDITKVLKNGNTALAQTEKLYANMTSEQKAEYDALTKQQKQINQSITGRENLINTLKQQKQQFEAQKQAGQDTAAIEQQIVETEASLADSTSNLTTTGLEYSTQLVDLLQKLGLLNEESAQAAKEQLNLASNMENTNMSFDDFRNNVDRPVKMDTADLIAGFGQLVSSISFAVNGVKSFISICQDSDASIGEMLTSFLTLLPSLVMAANGFNKFNIQLIKSTLYQKLAGIQTSKNAALNVTEAATERVKGDAALEAGAKSAAGAAMALGPLGLIYAIIVAIIAVLLIVINLVKSALENARRGSISGRLESARESAEKLHQKLEEVEEQNKKIEDSTKAYDEARQKLNSCKTGTEEWKEALEETNKAGQDLIRTLLDAEGIDTNKVNDLIKYDERGALTVDTESDAFKEIIEQLRKIEQNTRAEEDVTKVTIASLTSQQILEGAMEDVSAMKGPDGYWVPYDSQSQALRSGNISISQAEMIQLAEFMESRNVTQKAGFEEALKESFLTSDQQDLLATKANSFIHEFMPAVKNAKEALSDAQVAAKLAVEDIIPDASAAEKTYAAQKIVNNSANLQKQFENFLTDTGDGTVTLDGVTYEIGGDNFSQGQNAVNLRNNENKTDQFLESVAKALGVDKIYNTGNVVQGDDNLQNRTFVFNVGGGKTITMSAEELANTLASYQAAQEAGDTEGYIKMMDEITDDQTKKIVNARLASGNTGFNNLTAEELSAAKDADLTPDALKAMGFNNKEEYEAALQTQLDRIKNAAQNLDGSKNVKQRFENLYGNNTAENQLRTNATVEGAEAVAQMLNTVEKQAGTSGLSTVTESLQDLPTNKMEDVAAFVNGLDDATVTPEQIEEGLKNIDEGLASSDLGDTIYEVCKAGAERAKQDIESTHSKIATLRDVSGKITKENQIVSPEDIETMQEAGVATDTFFKQLADGTYQLTASLSDFQQVINQMQLNEITSNIASRKQTIGEITKKSNLKDLFGDGTESSDPGLFNDFNFYNGKWGESGDWLWNNDNNNVGDVKNKLFSTMKMMQTLGGQYQEVLDGLGYNLTDLEAGIYDKKLKKVSDDIYYEMKRKNGGKLGKDFAEAVKKYINDTIDLERQQIDLDFQQAVTSTGLDYAETEKYAQELQELTNAKNADNKANQISIDQARQMAIQNQLLARGIKDLKDNWDKYSKILKTANAEADKDIKQTKEYQDALKAFGRSAADALGLIGDISDATAEKLANNEDFENAIANNDIEGLQKIRSQVVLDTMTEWIPAEDEWDPFLERWGDNLDTLKTEAQGAMATIQGILQQGLTLPDMDKTQRRKYATALNTLAKDFGWTADQIKDSLAGIEAVPEITYEEGPEVPSQQMASTMVTTQTESTWDPASKMIVQKPENGEWEEVSIPSTITYTVSQPGPLMTTQATKTSVPQIKMVPGSEDSDNPTPALSFSPPSIPRTIQSAPMGGSGSGGGGSKKRSSRPKVIKPTKKKISDPYKDEQQSIDKATRSIEKYDRAKNNNFGVSRVRAIQAQNNELEKLFKAEANMYKTAIAEEKKNRQTLVEMGAAKMPGFVFEFDEEGAVKNQEAYLDYWQKVLDDADAKRVAAEQAYEDAKLAADSEDDIDESLRTNFEDAKEYYDMLSDQYEDIDEVLKDHQEALDKERETLETTTEKIKQYLSNSFEIIKYKMEIRHIVSDDLLKRLDEVSDRLGDLAHQLGVSTKLTRQQIVIQQEQLVYDAEALKAGWGIADNWMSGAFDQKLLDMGVSSEALQKYKEENETPQELIDFLDDLTNQVQQTLNDLLSNLEEFWSTYLDVYDNYIKKFEDISADLERRVGKIDLFKTIYTAFGLSDAMLFDKTNNNSSYTNEYRSVDYHELGRRSNSDILYAQQTQIRIAQEEKIATERAWNHTRKDLDEFIKQHGSDISKMSAADQVTYKNLIDYEERLSKQFLTDQQNLYATISEGIQQVQSNFEEEVQTRLIRLVRNMSVEGSEGIRRYYSSLDDLTSFFSLLQEEAKWYIDDENEAVIDVIGNHNQKVASDLDYELNKMISNMNQYLKEVTDPSRLAAWEEFEQKINDLREQRVKLTQNDLDVLNAEFELQKLYDQYEDAKNAKDTMRLARDASGNWSYVYSQTNPNQADQIAQQIEDQLQKIKKLHETAVDEMENAWLQNRTQWQQYLADVDLAKYEADLNYRGIVDQAQADYQRKNEYYTNEIIKNTDALGKAFEDTSLGYVTGSKSITEANEQWDSAQTKFFEDSQSGWQNYMEEFLTMVAAVVPGIEGIVEDFKQGGVTINGVLGEVAHAMSDNLTIMEYGGDKSNPTENSLQGLANKVNQISEDEGWSFVIAQKRVSEAAERISSQIASIIKQLDTLVQRLRDLKAESAAEALFDSSIDYGKRITNAIGVTESMSSKDIEDLVGEQQISLAERQLAFKQRFPNKEFVVANGTKKRGDQLSLDDVKYLTTQLILENQRKGIYSFDSDVYYPGGTPKGHATGGLIKQPEIAALAEDGKSELVLNHTDTMRILEAVRLVRETADSLSSNALVNDLVNRYNAVINQNNSDSTPVAQAVQIDASFPNVSVASEIEDALNDLINGSIQYINENK